MAQELTTLARMKAWYAATPSQNVPNAVSLDDDLLQSLISGVSMDILSYLQRPGILRATYPEYYDGVGGNQILLRQWPVLAVNSMTVAGQAQNSATPQGTGYFLDPAAPYPPGKQQLLTLLNGGGRGCIPCGQRNVYVNYDAGYAITAEAGAVPAAAPYTIKAQQPYGAWMQDDGVKNAATGAALTKVTGVPSSGQYSVAAGVYSFAAADTGLGVLLAYSYAPGALEKACFKMTAEEYAYRQHIGQKSHTVGGQTTITFDSSIMTPAIAKMLQPFMRVVPAYV